MRRIVLPITIVASLAIARAPQARVTNCLRYEPDTVSITGRLARHVFYGAPGFGDDPQHDELEPGFYLDLSQAVCTVKGRNPDDPKSGVRRIQLLLDSAGYSRFRPSLGKVITVRGTLVGAMSGHHHAPLLLDVLVDK